MVIFVLQPRRSCSKGSADISCGLRCCWSHSYRYIVQGIPRWNTLEDIRTSHAIVSSWRVQGICQEIPCPVFQIDRKRRSPLNKRCSQIRGNLGHPRLHSVGGGQSDWSVRSQSRFRTECESVEDPEESVLRCRTCETQVRTLVGDVYWKDMGMRKSWSYSGCYHPVTGLSL